MQGVQVHPHFFIWGACITPPLFLPEMTTSCLQQFLCILKFTGQMEISNCLPPHFFSACYPSASDGIVERSLLHRYILQTFGCFAFEKGR